MFPTKTRGRWPVRSTAACSAATTRACSNPAVQGGRLRNEHADASRAPLHAALGHLEGDIGDKIYIYHIAIYIISIYIYVYMLLLYIMIYIYIDV